MLPRCVWAGSSSMFPRLIMIIPILLLFVQLPIALPASAYQNQQYKFSIDIPEGWLEKAVPAETPDDPIAVFVEPSGEAIITISIIRGDIRDTEAYVLEEANFILRVATQRGTTFPIGDPQVRTTSGGKASALLVWDKLHLAIETTFREKTLLVTNEDLGIMYMVVASVERESIGKHEASVDAALASFKTLEMPVAIPAAESPNQESVRVKVGDWWKYEWSDIALMSSDPDFAPPFVLFQFAPEEQLAQFRQLEAFDWVKNEVTDISGSIVTVTQTIHFDNGRQTEGERSAPHGKYRGIDLSDLKLTDTITRTYAGEARQVDYYSSLRLLEKQITQYSVDAPPFEGTVTATMIVEEDVYLDKTTAVPAESLRRMLMIFPHPEKQGEEITMSMEIGLKIIETNMWGSVADVTPVAPAVVSVETPVTEQPFRTDLLTQFGFVIVIAVVIGVASLFVLRSRKKKPSLPTHSTSTALYTRGYLGRFSKTFNLHRSRSEGLGGTNSLCGW